MTLNLYDPVRNPNPNQQQPKLGGLTQALQAGLGGFNAGLGIIDAMNNIKGSRLDLQQKQVQTRDLLSQENIKNTVNRLQEGERLIAAGATPQQLEQTLLGYIQESEARGGNPIDSIQALEALRAGGVQGLSNILGQAKQAFISQGLIAAPSQGVNTASFFAKVDPSKFTPESVSAFQQTGQFGDLMPISAETADPEYVKELRKELRDNTTKLETEARSLKTNFGKLKNLAEEMRGGNRSAVAQGLVALVKLGDPGSVVKEEELKQALGAQSPTAAVADLLRGKGVDDGVANSIIQSLDPLNPAAVNVDQVLSTAEAMLKPNVETITTAYNAAKDRAGQQLTQGGFNSIFGSRQGLFDELSGLSFGSETQAQPQAFTSPSGIQFTVE